jgi:hypothetical protein
VAHRNTSFQPLPRPLGLAPYRYNLGDGGHFPEIAGAITGAKKMVIHIVGDSGGVKDGEFQGNVAEAMIQHLGAATDKPQFCYHVGDVVYFTGDRNEYYAQRSTIRPRRHRWTGGCGISCRPTRMSIQSPRTRRACSSTCRTSTGGCSPRS